MEEGETMNSYHSGVRSGWQIKSIWLYVSALLFLGVIGMGGTALAEGDNADGFWDAVTGGKPSLDMRARIEIADADPSGPAKLDQSEAYTLRTRLGYGTKPWHGGLLFAEAENVTAVATSQYFSLTEPPTGQTPIADPTVTEVNQAYLKIQRDDLVDYAFIGGRQRIKLDDDRFVGNVGWRQNEQTYDALLGASSLGVEDLSVAYGFVRYVRRIFGESRSSSLPQLDLTTNAHVIHASYGGLDPVKIAGFIYLLDVRDIAALSSASYGFRVTGSTEVMDDLDLIYEGSYAYQTDYADQPVDYETHYVMAQLKAAQSDLGTIGVGWEMLGSDNGAAQFVTPLATAHKFNGWADVFLGNGGPAGLRDFFVSVAPKLPYKFSGVFVYHNFRSDDKDKLLGNEYDLLLKRPINDHLTLLTKAAIFESERDELADIWRIWLQAEVKF